MYRRSSSSGSRMTSTGSPLQPNQIGVVCTIGDEVVGLDLFDRPTTLASYLRGIVAGHALDASGSTSSPDAIHAIERFLAQVDATDRDSARRRGSGRRDPSPRRGLRCRALL